MINLSGSLKYNFSPTVTFSYNDENYNNAFINKNFIMEEQESTSPDKGTVKIKDGIIEYYDNIDNNSILFYGRAGSGKTFLINCIANELINKSHTVLYLTAVSFFDLLSKITFNQKESSAFGQITKHELLQCDVLIIDDLGSEMANSFTNSALFDCLNYRLIHHKSTIISTNFSLSDLNEVYTDRTFSRILGNYNTFKIFGDDIRIKSKFNN